MSDDVDNWDKNLGNLWATHERLAYQLASAQATDVLIEENGRTFLVRGENRLELRDPFFSDLSLKEGMDLVIFGVGEGKLIQSILQSEQNIKIFVIEPNFSIVYSALKSFGWAEAIESHRLSFHTILIETQEYVSIAVRETVGRLQDGFEDVQFLESGSAYLNSGFFKLVEAYYQKSLSNQKDLQSFEVGKKNEVRDVTVISPACHIFNDLADAFRKLDYQVLLLPVTDVSGNVERDERLGIYKELKENPSRLVISRNRVFFGDPNSGPLFLKDGENELEGQFLNWWWDLPDVANRVDYQVNGPEVKALGFSRETVKLLPPDSELLPPGALSKFTGYESQESDVEKKYPVTFVGASRLGLFENAFQALRQNLTVLGFGQKIQVIANLIDQGDFEYKYFIFQSNRSDIADLIRKIAQIWPHPAYYLAYLLEMCGSILFRLAAIEKVIREKIPIHLFGDEGWLKVEGVTQENFHGILSPDSLPNLYRQSQVNLNLNFFQVGTTVNPKVLDICACGGEVITDFRFELNELYPDENCRPVSFSNLEELPGLINEKLKVKEETRLKEIQTYTIKHHTLLERAKSISENYLDS